MNLNGPTEYPCNQIINNVQAQPTAAAAQPGGEKGVKNPFKYLFRDTRTVIHMADLYMAGIERRGADADRARVPAGEAVDQGVAD